MINNQALTIRTFFLNFGPQHPAAHGVLRLILEVSGEIIKNVTVNIGLLHRGTEKLLEYKTLSQGLPYFDRLDYVSVLAQEHAFCLAVESNLGISVPKRASLIRVLGEELTRILNHIMGLTTHALDVGAMTPFLWGFEEREKIMSLCEMLSGSRVHMGYFCIGGVMKDLPANFLKTVYQFTVGFISRLNELEDLLAENRIWQGRLVGIGNIVYSEGLNYYASGPMLRASGGVWDLRKTTPYEMYSQLTFSVPVGLQGDSYDRFLIRIEEMRQSILIVQQVVNNFSNYSKSSLIGSNTLGNKETMESLILKFKNLLGADYKGLLVEGYTSLEAPKGETGVYLALDGSVTPNRCKITSPAYRHLQMLPYMANGLYISDIVTIIGTQDIVFGEVDR